MLLSISELIAYAKTDETELKKHEFGFFPNFVEQDINRKTGVRVTGVTKIITSDSIRHIIKGHGDDKSEKERGQKGITDSDIELIPKIVANFDSVVKGNDKRGQSVVFIKQINGIGYYVAMNVKNNLGDPKLEVRTMFAKPIKKADV